MSQDLTKKKEKEIVKECMADLTSFSTLYEAYQEEIYKYCYYKLYNSDLASDITSDVFTKALTAISQSKYQYDDKVGFGGWIYRIAHNAICDHYKSKASKNSTSLDESPQFDQDQTDTVVEIEQKLDTNQRLTMIQQELALFDDQTQSIFVLKYTNELTFDEIAQTLELNKSTIKMKYYRALEVIKQKITISNRKKEDSKKPKEKVNKDEKIKVNENETKMEVGEQQMPTENIIEE